MQLTGPYTLAEAAVRLRKSKRWLQAWLAENPMDAAGRPFCSKLGRSRLFREGDIERILDASMSAPPCRSSFSRPAPEKRRTGPSAAATCASLLTEAQELLGEAQLNLNSVGSKRPSNVVNIRPGQSR